MILRLWFGLVVHLSWFALVRKYCSIRFVQHRSPAINDYTYCFFYIMKTSLERKARLK